MLIADFLKLADKDEESFSFLLNLFEDGPAELSLGF